MKNTNDTKIIELLYQAYNNNIFSIPKLDNIIYTDVNEYKAQVLTKDLYNKKYILHINKKIMDYCFEALQPIIYHEFTHIADSIKFHDYSQNDFYDLMNSYSESHGAEIEMNCRLSFIKENINLHSNIIYNDGILSLKSFMEQTFNKIKNNFDLMKNNYGNNIFFDILDFYYYLGYIKSLHNYNIKYEFKFYDINISFMKECDDIATSMPSDSINFSNVIVLYNKLINSIKRKNQLNNITISF